MQFGIFLKILVVFHGLILFKNKKYDSFLHTNPDFHTIDLLRVQSSVWYNFDNYNFNMKLRGKSS